MKKYRLLIAFLIAVGIMRGCSSSSKNVPVKVAEQKENATAETSEDFEQYAIYKEGELYTNSEISKNLNITGLSRFYISDNNVYYLKYNTNTDCLELFSCDKDYKNRKLLIKRCDFNLKFYNNSVYYLNHNLTNEGYVESTSLYGYNTATGKTTKYITYYGNLYFSGVYNNNLYYYVDCNNGRTDLYKQNINNINEKNIVFSSNDLIDWAYNFNNNLYVNSEDKLYIIDTNNNNIIDKYTCYHMSSFICEYKGNTYFEDKENDAISVLNDNKKIELKYSYRDANHFSTDYAFVSSFSEGKIIIEHYVNDYVDIILYDIDTNTASIAATEKK